MSTANIPSSRVTDIQIGTSLKINENNGAETNATTETPSSGLFITPSEITTRAADVTGFFVTSENEYGKLGFTDPDGLVSLAELSDVTLTTPAANEVLQYDGAEWVNTADLTGLTSLTTSSATLGLATTDTVGFYGVTPVVQQDTLVTAAAFVANTSAIADDTATFGGYTLGQVVAALQAYGILA